MRSSLTPSRCCSTSTSARSFAGSSFARKRSRLPIAAAEAATPTIIGLFAREPPGSAFRVRRRGLAVPSLLSFTL